METLAHYLPYVFMVLAYLAAGIGILATSQVSAERTRTTIPTFMNWFIFLLWPLWIIMILAGKVFSIFV